MNPYSHIVLAANLEEQLRPANLNDYYLGAVVPDIRHLCGWRRRQTHLPLERLDEFADQYPHLESFVLGYRVHCLIDEFDPSQGVLRFPLNLMLKRLPKQFLPVVIESYYLFHRAVRKNISESGNEILASLGVDRGTLATFSKYFNTFLSAPSLEAWIGLAQSLGISSRGNVGQYVKAAQALKRHRVLRELLFASMDIVGLERQVNRYVLARYGVDSLASPAGHAVMGPLDPSVPSG